MAVGESVRSATALKNLAQVRLFGIAEELDGCELFADAVCVTDVHNSEQLIQAARALTEKHGPLHHIVTAQETLLLPAQF